MTTISTAVTYMVCSLEARKSIRKVKKMVRIKGELIEITNLLTIYIALHAEILELILSGIVLQILVALLQDREKCSFLSCLACINWSLTIIIGRFDLH